MSRRGYGYTTVTDDCAIRSCALSVIPPRLFCREHWHMLPDTIQHEIGRAVLAGDRRGVMHWCYLADKYVRGAR
jgi:hypothetical protein